MVSDDGIALVIDTDLPVDCHFADNLSAFCIGFGGKNAIALWRDCFFKDMRLLSYAFSPFSYHLWRANKICSPWPNPSWAWNGYYNYANLDQKVTLNGRLLDPISLLTFNKPALMSVAIFFGHKLHEVFFEIVKVRSKKFCSQYPNAREGRHHKVTAIHYAELNHTPSKGEI